jgi:hypothetical protein
MDNLINDEGSYGSDLIKTNDYGTEYIQFGSIISFAIAEGDAGRFPEVRKVP